MPLHQNTVLLFTGKYHAHVTVDEYFICNRISNTSYLHQHARFEINYILRGSCRTEIGGKELVANAGSFIIIPPLLEHAAFESVAGTDGYLSTFVLTVEKEPKSYDILDGTNSQIAVPFLELPDAVCIEDTFDGLALLQMLSKELGEKRYAYREKLRGGFLLLVTELARKIDTHNQTAVVFEDGYLEAMSYAERIEAFLLESYRDPDLSCDDLSAYLNVSNRQLNRLMQKYFHTSFRQMLLNVRMFYATSFLRDTKLNISEIAETLGYNSAATFSATYKRFHGHSPLADNNESETENLPDLRQFPYNE